jgi:hypothetical protein
MKEIESISAALFDKVRSRFPGVTLGDESAKATQDPEKARFFNFTYTGEDGAEFGKVTISLIDETSLKIYFGQDISGDMDRDQRKAWYEFLRNLRLFAKRNLLVFDTRDINKSNLQIQDIKQQAKTDSVFTSNNVEVTESRLYGTPGRPYNSFADKGATKILIRHKDKVNDEIRGSRARQIQEIFLETERGERFLLKHTNLHGARAMAEHLNNGGELHDEFAQHLDEMVAEMSAMRHFVRSTKHRQFEDQETADMTQAAINHYEQNKRTLRNLSRKRYYDEYRETFQPKSAIEDDIDVAALRERFVKKVYDDRFNDALPIVARAYQQQAKESAGRLGNELDEWASSVTEGTWAKPDSADKIKALRELLKTPLPVGIDGIDAQAKIESIIGDDDLNDSIHDLASSQGPDADATSLVKEWLVQHMPDLLDQMQIGQNNSRDAETNWSKPVSPQSAQGDEYGSQPSHPNVSNMTYEDSDPLEFIRNLAGLKK